MCSYLPPPPLGHRVRYTMVERQPVQAGTWNLCCFLYPKTKTYQAIFNSSIHTCAQLGLQVQTPGGAQHFPRQKPPSVWKKNGPKNNFIEIRFRTARLLSPIQFLVKFQLNFKIFSNSKSNPTSRPSLFSHFVGFFFSLLVQLKP